MVYDADGKGDIECAGFVDLVDTLLAHLYSGETSEVQPRVVERAIVHVDGKAAQSTVGHRPVGVTADAAAGVDKPQVFPKGFVDGGPAKKLFLVRRQQNGV